jgi:hypothetical protein
MNENTNTNTTANFGQLIIGDTLEIGTSTKNGITTKANYYRLNNKQDLPLIGSKLITSSKDKVDFAVNVRVLEKDRLLEFINSSAADETNGIGAKVIQYLTDCFYATYKEMANAAYNCQSKVIKLELIDVVEFATMARSRMRKAISFTGEAFKLAEVELVKALIMYADKDKNVKLSVEQAKKTMQTIKLLLTIEQLIPTEKQLDTLAGIFSYVPEGELSNNLGAVIELKNELFNSGLEIGAEESFV